MAATTARHRRGPTPAQGLCVTVGVVLIAAGALGFIGNANFAGADHRGSFLGLDVHGWHNVVHITTGLLLPARAPNPTPPRPVCVLFPGAYAAVAGPRWVDRSD